MSPLEAVAMRIMEANGDCIAIGVSCFECPLHTKNGCVANHIVVEADANTAILNEVTSYLLEKGVITPTQEPDPTLNDITDKEVRIKVDYQEVHKRNEMLKWFGNVQMAKLLENAHKGNAGLNDVSNMLHRLEQEIAELKAAIDLGSHQEIIRECGDVANFAMFIASHYNQNKGE